MTTSSNPAVTTREPTAEELAEQQDRQDNLDAGVGIEDGDHSNPDTGAAMEPEHPAEPEPGQRVVIQKSPADVARDAIAKRFRREEETPFNGDMTDRANLYGDVARTYEDPEPGASMVGERMETGDGDGDPPAPQPKMYTIKVRGKEITLTEDEVLERASKVEAADSYLAESREILDAAKQVRAERTSSDHHRPDDRNGAQDDGLNVSDPERGQRPGPDFKSVVEKIQFGDPEEAARELEDLVDRRASSKAQEGHIARLFNNDLAKSQQALRDFTAKNADLANDPNAAVIIERTMYDIYREDIRKLGVVDEAQIPTDPKTLANWHRFYRVHGHDVRGTADALNEAKARYENWRGVSTSKGATPATPSNPAAKPAGAPRVNVNVDRTARRAAIPNQPTRAAAPRPNPTTPQTRADPSSIIAKMRKARGQV